MGLSKQAWLGVAKEATAGTALNPTVYVPTKATFKAKKKREFMNEERGDRNMNYGVVDSVRQCDIGLKGPWYNDTHPYFILGGMGVDTVTSAGTGAYKHSFSLTTGSANPPSLTLTRSLDTAIYQSPYSVVEKFSIKFTSDKLLEFDATCIGQWPNTISTINPSYSTLLPMAGYSPNLTRGGVGTNDISEVTVSFSQKISLWYPASGSADYITAYFGERFLEFDFVARFDNVSLYNRFLNNQNDSFAFDFTGQNISGSVNNELNVTIPNVTYDEMDHDMGKDHVTMKCKGKALASTTQFFSIFVVNSVPNYNV